MKITRENYEIWFLDYLEERLDQEQGEMVRQFLAHHPDLADELEAFVPVLAADEHLIYPDKSHLKRAVYDDPAIFETTAIADMEGDLTTEERSQFEKWLATKPDRQKFIRILKRSRLQPDPSIDFPGKGELKKKHTVMPLWARIAAMAASLLMVLLIFYPGRKNTDSTISGYIENKVPPQMEKPVKTATEISPKVTSTSALNPRTRPIVANPDMKLAKHKIEGTAPSGNRQFDSVEPLQTRLIAVNFSVPEIPDLVPLKVSLPISSAPNEIPLSDFLKDKLQELKANGKKTFITREEVTIAGLHLFSRLPGKHLTGKEGRDGRLRTITFNTQLLAFSIPVNL